MGSGRRVTSWHQCGTSGGRIAKCLHIILPLVLQGEVVLDFPKEVLSVTRQVLYDECSSNLFLLWSDKGGLVSKVSMGSCHCETLG